MTSSRSEGAWDHPAQTVEINDAKFENHLQRGLLGQNDLKIVGRMKGESMVFGVTRPKTDMVVPTEKAEDVKKESV